MIDPSHSAWRSLLLLACLMLAACTDVDPIPADTCGNKVLEPLAGEDCDGEANCRAAEEANGCRFRCKRDEAECPDGFGCGLDGVCRRAAGSYSVVDLQLATPTVSLEVADLDGDQRQDVVRNSVDKTFVHFFDTGVVTAKVNSVLKPPSLPFLGDLTGDGRADMAFIEEVGIKFGSGLAVFRSQSDRTFKSTTYSSIPLQGRDVRAVSVRAVSPFTDDESVVMVDDNIVGFGGDGILAPLWRTADFHVTELTGMLAGNFDETMGVGPCDELAYALGGADRVNLFHLCTLSGGEFDWDRHPSPNSPPATREILLPPNVSVFDFPDDDDDDGDGGAVGLAAEEQSLLSADFNDDGHLDLAIVTANDTTPDVPTVHVAFGLGDGSFHSVAALPLPTTGDNFASPLVVKVPNNARCNGELKVPLAFADFNGDGFQDVVSEEVLMVSQGAANDFRTLQCEAEWRSALVADLNGDGRLDIAAARNDDPGIEFFSGAGDGTFAKSVVPTKLPASLLDMGDFDGDLIADLVYVELGDDEEVVGESGTTPTADAQVFVAFGRAARPPEIPIQVGELEFVEGLVTGRFEGGDSTADIVLASRPLDLSPDGKLGLALVGGDANRQLHAPFLFAVPASWVDSIPITLKTEVAWAAFGRFNDADLGMAVFTQDEDLTVTVSGNDIAVGADAWRSWRVSSDERGKFSLSQSDDISGIRDSDLNCEDCIVAAVDLDGDGIDELVTFQDLVINIYDSVAGVIEHRDQIDTELSFVTVWDDEFVDGPTVRDVDLDGNADVSLVLDNGGVLVIWGDGSGELALSGATTIAGGDFGPITDIAFLNTDSDPELELVLVSEYLLPTISQLDLETRSFEALDAATELVPLQEDILVFGTTVTAGDFDGDGVDDIAVGDYLEYAILRGERVRP